MARGNAPSDAQLAELTARYEAIAPEGGDVLSPLAARTEAQRAALQVALDRIAPGEIAVLLGLKHAAPTIEDAAAEVAAGAREGQVERWSAWQVPGPVEEEPWRFVRAALTSCGQLTLSLKKDGPSSMVRRRQAFSPKESPVHRASFGHVCQLEAVLRKGSAPAPLAGNGPATSAQFGTHDGLGSPV